MTSPPPGISIKHFKAPQNLDLLLRGGPELEQQRLLLCFGMKMVFIHRAAGMQAEPWHPLQGK